MVRSREDDPSAPTLSLAAGLALIESIDVAVRNQPLILKWPNDLLLSGKKLAGILLERNGDRIVVGFGVNLARAPDFPGRPGAALGGQIDPPAFAPLLAEAFARLLDVWRTSESSGLVRAWQQRAHPIGASLSVHTGPDEILSGRFAGLDPDGALRLMLDDGRVEVVRAADVFLG